MSLAGPAARTDVSFTDTHAHLDMLGGADEVAAALRRAAEAGVVRVVAVGGDPVRNAAAAGYADRFGNAVHAAVGLDRDWTEEAGGDAERGVRDLFGCSPGVVAVGEIGLDYHYLPQARDRQMDLFALMLALARDVAAPVVVHSRAAEQDTLDLLRAHAAAWRGDADRIGVLHCFTGDAAFARSVVDLGLFVSFSGIVSFRTADALREVARQLPGDRLLIETDAPFLAPVPHRGRANEPALLPFVAEAMARARGTTVETVAELTSRNAARLFGWDAL